MVRRHVLPEPAVTVPVLATSGGLGTVVERRVVEQVAEHPTPPARVLRPPPGLLRVLVHRSAYGGVSASSSHAASKTSRRGAQPVVPMKAAELTRSERVTGSS